MITVILRDHLATLLTIFITATAVFMMGSYFIVKFFKTGFKRQSAEDRQLIKAYPIPNKSSAMVVTSKDISAIAGENETATQLDLARAYIESGRKQLAGKILNHIVSAGNEQQQLEAKRLLVMANQAI